MSVGLKCSSTVHVVSGQRRRNIACLFCLLVFLTPHIVHRGRLGLCLPLRTHYYYLLYSPLLALFASPFTLLLLGFLHHITFICRLMYVDQAQPQRQAGPLGIYIILPWFWERICLSSTLEPTPVRSRDGVAWANSNIVASI